MTLAYLFRGAKKRSKNSVELKQYEDEQTDWAKKLFEEFDNVNHRT